MRIFIDHNLSPKIARALQPLFEGKHEVVSLRDKFPINISDKDWIETLSKEGRWVVISGDLRITKNAAEKQAFKNSKLIGFFMSPGFFKAGPILHVSRILFQWRKLEKIIEAMEPGATFQITETRIKQI